MQLYIFILFIILSYLYGSINNGILISKYFHGIDIRDFGSHGAGSTNTLRTLGKKSALAVFILDILKPIIPVIIAKLFFPIGFDIPGDFAWIALAAVIGQCYPIFFHFKGGKGAASTLGTMIILLPLVVIGAAIIFFIIIGIKKIVSLATIVAIGLSTISVAWLYPQYLIPYICLELLIFWRHRENIQRLANGTERTLSQKEKIEK